MDGTTAIIFMTTDISDEEFFKKVDAIKNELKEAKDVYGRDELCSRFSISHDYFAELYVSYKIPFESSGHDGDVEWNDFALSMGFISQEEMNLASSDEHHWVLIRIKMRLHMDEQERLRREAQITKNESFSLFGIMFPEKIGPFFLGETTNYETTTPGLGYSVVYTAHFGEVNAYIYDKGIEDIPDGPNGDIILEQFKQEASGIINRPKTEDCSIEFIEQFGTGSPERGAEFLCAVFGVSDNNGNRYSYLYLTGYEGKLVKLRCTIFAKDPKGYTSRNFADDFASILWAPQKKPN
jgi:hypothetical protein